MVRWPFPLVYALMVIMFRFSDIISEVITVGDAAVTLSPTAGVVPRSLKRPHEDDYDSVSHDKCVHPTAPCDASSTANSQPSGSILGLSFDNEKLLLSTRLSAPSLFDSSPFGIGLPLHTEDAMNPNIPYLQENPFGGFGVLPNCMKSAFETRRH